MLDRNQTSLRECRFLDYAQFTRLFDTFTRAFADYVVPFALTEIQFRNHINLTAVDLERSVGCFEGEKMIGFSMNGFGTWDWHRTVYGAGTGVLPEYRRQGVSQSMFEFMLPIFRERGFERFLLEVITTNDVAIRLYERLGFTISRELSLLQCDIKTTNSRNCLYGIEIKEIRTPDWNTLSRFWDGRPAWQNSTDSIDRSLILKRILGAFLGDDCIGYIVFSSRFGRVSQLAVSKEHRRAGIGTALLNAMHTHIDDGFSAQIINVDKGLNDAMVFFENMGYYERLCQYEMVLSI